MGGDGVFVYYHFRSVGMILFIMIDDGSMFSWQFLSQGMFLLLGSVIGCVSLLSLSVTRGMLVVARSATGDCYYYHARSRGMFCLITLGHGTMF